MPKAWFFFDHVKNTGPLYGILGCQIYGIMGSVSGIGAAISNTAISFDRYRWLHIKKTFRETRLKVEGKILNLRTNLFSFFLLVHRTIAKPFDGKLSHWDVGRIIVFIWLYAMPFTILPALQIWGRFVPEGYLTSCTFDYMADTGIWLASQKILSICLNFGEFLFKFNFSMFISNRYTICFN